VLWEKNIKTYGALGKNIKNYDALGKNVKNYGALEKKYKELWCFGKKRGKNENFSGLEQENIKNCDSSHCAKCTYLPCFCHTEQNV